MTVDTISTPEKVGQLKEELYLFYQEKNLGFKRCHSMGEIVKMNLKQTLRKNLLLIPKIHSRFGD